MIRGDSGFLTLGVCAVLYLCVGAIIALLWQFLLTKPRVRQFVRDWDFLHLPAEVDEMAIGVMALFWPPIIVVYLMSLALILALGLTIYIIWGLGALFQKGANLFVKGKVE